MSLLSSFFCYHIFSGFTRSVNILGFSCQDVIYKGKVLGYKLHIDYTNPME